MTYSELEPPAHNRATVDQSHSTGWRLSRRTRMAAAGAAATMLLGGAYLLLGDPAAQHDLPDVAGRAKVDAAVISSPTTHADSPTTRRKAPGTPSLLPSSVEARVAAARTAAAKNRVEPLHPVTPNQDAAAMAAADTAQVTTVGSPTDSNGTMRIVTARGDLTGQRELAWIAGGVTTHGSASCSHTVKLYNEKAAVVRPNLLVCWRTSARKSVVAVAAVVKGSPSVDRSIATIDEQWRKLR